MEMDDVRAASFITIQCRMGIAQSNILLQDELGFNTSSNLMECSHYIIFTHSHSSHTQLHSFRLNRFVKCEFFHTILSANQCE